MKSNRSKQRSNNTKIPWQLIAETTGLTKAQISDLRNKLLAKRKELVSHMTDLMLEFSDAGNGGGDSNELVERANELEAAEMAANLYSSQSGDLSEIDEAIERLEDGTYGICVAGEEPIGIARLQARPWAERCIKCASQFERSHARSRRSRRESTSYPQAD